MTIPGEVRNRIYEYLFCDQLKLEYKLPRRRIRTLKSGLNLLLTCRDLEEEVDSFVWTKATFFFFSDQALFRFAGMVTDTDLARIRDLYLDVPDFKGAPIQGWKEVIEKVIVTKFTGLRRISVDIQPARAVWVRYENQCGQHWLNALKPLRSLKQLDSARTCISHQVLDAVNVTDFTSPCQDQCNELIPQVKGNAHSCGAKTILERRNL